MSGCVQVEYGSRIVPDLVADLKVAAGRLVVFLVVLVGGCAVGVRAGDTQPAGIPCEEELVAARATIPGGQSGVPLNGAVVRAMTLFRFGRNREAIEKLDTTLEKTRGKWGQRLAADRRRETLAAIERLRGCMASRQPAATATLTIETFILDPTMPGGQGKRAGAGVHVEVEQIPVGQTRDDGVLTVEVPSGKIHVTARTPSSAWGERDVSLDPGSARTTSIVLDPDKEVVEDTELVLRELDGETLPSTATTFTLQFTRDDAAVPVKELDRVEWRDNKGNLKDLLNSLFAIVGGAISATDPTGLYALLSKHPGEIMEVQVQAVDAAGFTHAGTVQFRIEPRR